jgi:hypothetical protein
MAPAGELERPHVEFFALSTEINVEPASNSVIGDYVREQRQPGRGRGAG